MDISITTNLTDRQEIEKEVDEAVARFDQWFRDRGNDPIIRSEKAIIKTFMYFMLFERKDV